ncbi:hypothetical protein [Microcystis phage Mae-Yong924-2]|nr:hypothetical protein [Microcystis phage Mea-Yong924-1]QYC50709.1 hypothetical protein [Microcystis phage Mae-Yong924-2]
MSNTNKYSKSIKDARFGKLKHLPRNYAKTLQNRLKSKGLEFSVDHIRSVIQCRRTNFEIFQEAIRYADECRNIKKAASQA